MITIKSFGPILYVFNQHPRLIINLFNRRTLKVEIVRRYKSKLSNDKLYYSNNKYFEVYD